MMYDPSDAARTTACKMPGQLLMEPLTFILLRATNIAIVKH